MIIFIIITIFTKQSLASNSTLEGWQFDDNSRSSWDIFWTCLSTILACTWTALHLSVPRRDQSEKEFTFWKLVAWICAVLAPEMMAGTAAEQLLQARALVRRCNAAFCRVFDDVSNQSPAEVVDGEGEGDGEDISNGEGTLHGQEGTSPGKEATVYGEEATSTQETSPSTDEAKSPGHWSTAQGFCLTMNGVLLQTKDGWTYPVQPNNVVPLIEAGIVKSFHLRSRDIKDRAKADSFAKAFTLLQSCWVTVNIIARAAYNLPITPLEYSTVAYVACAAVTYATWWHKPRDMTTPILIFLPYDKDGSDMPPRIRKSLDEGHGSWVRLPQGTLEGPDIWSRVLRSPRAIGYILRMPFTSVGRKALTDSFKEGYAAAMENEARDDPSDPSDPSPSRQDEENARPSTADEPQPSKVNDPEERLTIASYVNVTHLYMFVSLLFCGIHVAAWNSEYPTTAEKIVWRVFSLSAFTVVWPMYILHLWIFYRLYRAAGDKYALVSGVDWMTARVLILWFVWFWVYSTARWGNLILMVINLRELPAGSYVTIDWMSTIPHI